MTAGGTGVMSFCGTAARFGRPGDSMGEHIASTPYSLVAGVVPARVCPLHATSCFLASLMIGRPESRVSAALLCLRSPVSSSCMRLRDVHSYPLHVPCLFHAQTMLQDVGVFLRGIPRSRKNREAPGRWRQHSSGPTAKPQCWEESSQPDGQSSRGGLVREASVLLDPLCSMLAAWVGVGCRTCRVRWSGWHQSGSNFITWQQREDQ